VDELDRIPWKDLTHAYGSAEDVPDLLRALRTCRPDLRGEESPLWHLYGNIWHQGTVYEATSYAVPFLIEIAADRHTLDRSGVLGLLAEIARGQPIQRKRRELAWVKSAHAAVAKGFDTLAGIAKEHSDVRLAAAHVLAQLPEYAAKVGSILHVMLARESRSLERAGILFLMGQMGDRSSKTLGVLSKAVNDKDIVQRRAAALSIAQLKLRPLPPGSREAIIEAVTSDELIRSFENLPWDVEIESENRHEEMLAHLDPSDRDQIADGWITAIESGEANHLQVCLLIHLLFPSAEKGPTPPINARDLSLRQLRAVRAMYKVMKGGKRVFYGYSPSYGLPDTMREWRYLAAGHDAPPVDDTLPLLAYADEPRKPLRPKRLKVGEKIVHRYFGMGTVTEVAVGGRFTSLKVLFEEEGEMNLSL
jgi:hypothetical protein